MKTNYTINNTAPYESFENGISLTKGFFDIESVLHSIWVLNDKNINHFYEAVDGVVYCREVRDES